MPKRIPAEIRREACERLLRGETAISVSERLHVSVPTLHRWKRQALVDLGLIEGVKSIEVDELAQARRTINELERELEITRAAAAIFNGEDAVGPKGGARLPRH